MKPAIPYTGIACAAAAALAGGGLFQLVGLPLAWMLGPAFAMMTVKTAWPQRIAWPRILGDAGVVVVAYLLGRSMTKATAVTILHDLPFMMATALLWLVLGFLVGWLFAKLARIDTVSGILGCSPGGLTQMVIVADSDSRADAGTVAIVQTCRILVVLYTVPFTAAWMAHAGTSEGAAAAGQGPAAQIAEASLAAPSFYGYLLLPAVPLAAWLLRRMKVPAGEFLGPVLLVGVLAASGFAWPEVPELLTAAAQACIGLFIGSRVRLRILLENKRLAPLALAAGGFFVSLTLAAAWAISAVAEGSIITWFLALSPGGLGEVAVTAMQLGANDAQVTAYQVFRLLFILFLVPFLVNLTRKKWKEDL
ncbi:AbrB family transcriptional regulator [Xylanibacillus composti]|uniref:Ammonia monooxygenase n=1 Tax=Xylanibacillus composti TaxID=1572762 RepID=A0A8J4H7G2_9BACL|nr:AbrB family transcriptional regulator [Xylanibacillus composti]GIQ69948.1 ammonia monooxygenase [Xylanibacillus composti]